ncbi:MAG TPA: efflux RND transporter periplasmic adaptor subunit [Puia sp.]|uniref:efflux RND transporter periplasmic adaptor subunit n=1 Tax=Puia sp. TaxID=2045100 RepID=UPI002D0B4965|nr:efflux RND transporter periplasmic adaptor subunit [Puia sp.]HVU96869.1 efflux RND transporter periplasmic adaptor subunit [Puia sp.]
MNLQYSIYGFLMVGLVACGSGTSKQENKKDSAVAAKPGPSGPVEIRLTEAQVKAIDLQVGSLEQRNLRTSLKVNGKLVLPPQNQAQVSSLVGGIVKSIRVKDGDFVRVGQVLATLQNNDVVQWQQDYLENKSQLRYLEAEYARQKSLRADSINSEKTLQQVENELGVAKARQTGIRTRLQGVGIRADGLAPDAVSSEIGIVAPIEGYIHHVNVTMGKYADANAALFDIVDNRALHLDLTVFEKDVHKLTVGQKVLFTDANDPLHDHPALIYSLDKAFQDNQQAIIAHARIGERTETLLPGMYVEARIQVDKYQALALPDAAVVSSGDDHFIYLESTPRVYRQVAVKTGASDLGYTEIVPLSELPKDTRIVTKGAYYLLSEATKGSSEE